MENIDYQLLENLLSKLGAELGYNFCILPNHVQDGFYIAMYDAAGNRFKEISGVSIENCVRQAKELTTSPI